MSAPVSVTVLGEAVLDVVETPDGGLAEVAGGSAANTALALTRLGVQTRYRGRLSTDSHGRFLYEHFAGQGVDMSEVITVDEPSSVIRAVISTDGTPTYHANLKGASDYGWRLDEISVPLANTCAAVNFGSLATVIEPGASVISQWLSELPPTITKCYDPNIRPGLMNRPDDEVRKQVEHLISFSNFVKASDVDVGWLYPNLAVSEVANNWAAQGPDLVVITLGENGAIASRPNKKLVNIEPRVISVADTIGAGDTFAAAVLNRVARDGFLGSKFNEWVMNDELLRQGLHEASIASAMTCEKKGANPPTWLEVSELLATR